MLDSDFNLAYNAPYDSGQIERKKGEPANQAARYLLGGVVLP
jgi:hypothetical protein